MKSFRNVREKQEGMTLIGLILISALVLAASLVLMKVTPALIEYSNVVRDVSAVAKSDQARDASVTDIRNAFMKRAQVDDISSITPDDLDISKEGGEVAISFAYAKKIPLFGPVSLLIDFQGGAAPHR